MTEELRQIHFPYCLDQQADGRYVVLNRHYKPLGFPNGEWVNYGDHPILWKIKGLGPKSIEQLSYKGDSNPKRIYLYNDACIPTDSAESMRDYLQRLGQLMKLRCEAD